MNWWKVFIAFWICSLPDFSCGFYKDYDFTFWKISSAGKVHLMFKFTFGNFKINDGDNVCDVGYAWPYYKCDISIYMFALVPGDFENRGLFYVIQEDLGKQIFENSNYSPLQAKYSLLGIDFSNAVFYYFENNNHPVNDKFENFYSSKYFKVVGICSLIDDLDLFYKKELMMKFCKYQEVPFLYQNVIIQDHNPETRSYVQFTMRLNCQKNYYGITCWKKCEDTPPRFHCDIDGNEVCDDYYEDILFHYHYRITDDVYLSFTNSDEYLPRCIFYNNCAIRMTLDKLCPPLMGLCYPLSNYTHTCLIFHPIYVISKYSETLNATFNSVVSGEYIYIEANLVGYSSALVKNHSLCAWTIPVWNDNFLELDVTTNLSIIQTTKKIKFGLYHFILICSIGRYRVFKFHRNFTIHALPLNFEIFNITFAKLTVYIGQNLKCLSDGVPQNISEHILLIVSQNFNNEGNKISSNTIYVPYDATTGYCIFECMFVFHFTDGRPSYNITHLFHFNIKSYIYFEWKRKYKNVYSIRDRAGCIYLAYYYGVLDINVMSGGEIFVYPTNNFSTDVKSGGIFRLMCILKPEFLSLLTFYRIKEFEIYKMPSRVCIQPHLAVPGALIRCGHDGYPPDQARYRLSINVENKEMTSSKTNYIRIPYITSSVDLNFNCKIKFTVFDVQKDFHYRVNIILSHVSSKIISFTDYDQICSMFFEEPIENAQQISAVEIIFEAEVFFLEEYYKSILELWFIVFKLFLTITISGMVMLRMPMKDFQFLRERSCIKRRQINDKLMDLAKIADIGKLEHIAVFKYKLSGHTVNLSELKDI